MRRKRFGRWRVESDAIIDTGNHVNGIPTEYWIGLDWLKTQADAERRESMRELIVDPWRRLGGPDFWPELGAIIEKQTGRRLLGTDGGKYQFGLDTMSVPDRDVEAAVHELCHWVVATESERRQHNLGLDSCSYEHLVLREEEAWSLEMMLFGDAPQEELLVCMSPIAVFSGSGRFLTDVPDRWVPVVPKDAPPRDEALRLAFVARETILRGTDHPRPDGTEAIRRRVVSRAEGVGLNVEAIKRIVGDEYGERRRILRGLTPDVVAELDRQTRRP